MTDQFNVTPVFRIPLYQSTLQTIDQDSIDYIKKTEYKRFPADNGYGSTDKFLLDKPALKNLKGLVMKHCEHFIHDVLDVRKDCKFEMTNSWSTKHIKGDESGAHNHANSMLSGVLYLQTDDDSGAILFHKDKSNFNLFTPTIDVPFNNEKLNVFNTDGWAIKPKNNMLILFPSTLYHSVYPNESDIERYVVAFNLFAFGKFGYDNVVQLGIENKTVA